MSRLRHSQKGFVRLMQMSRNQVFIFVEGWSDRYLYDRLARSECSPRRIEYEVRIGNELPSATGGKEAVLRFFAYLRRNHYLFDDFLGKRTVVVFFVDKDIDDILRQTKRSAHLVYTEHYDFENYLFLYGDLIAAGAAAAGLDEGSVADGLKPHREWLRAVATAWKEWLTLCVIARRYRAACSVSYRRPSPVNASPYSAVNATALRNYEAELQSACGLSSSTFVSLTQRTRRRILSAVNQGKADRLFKGKWYKYFLAADLRRIASGRQINSNGLEDRIVDVLKATIDLSGPWTNRYREALRAQIARL
jgi:hypothetical protein